MFPSSEIAHKNIRRVCRVLKIKAPSRICLAYMALPDIDGVFNDVKGKFRISVQCPQDAPEKFEVWVQFNGIGIKCQEIGQSATNAPASFDTNEEAVKHVLMIKEAIRSPLKSC